VHGKFYSTKNCLYSYVASSYNCIESRAIPFERFGKRVSRLNPVHHPNNFAVGGEETPRSRDGPCSVRDTSQTLLRVPTCSLRTLVRRKLAASGSAVPEQEIARKHLPAGRSVSCPWPHGLGTLRRPHDWSSF
jgi:hypothetical protein